MAESEYTGRHIEEIEKLLLGKTATRKVDLTGAKLAGASLIGTNVQNGRFACFDTPTEHGCADIRI